MQSPRKRYEPRPADPACQPYADAIAKLMEERGLSSRQMGALLYNYDVKQLPRGVGADFYVSSSGKRPPGPSLKRRFLEKTGLDLSLIPYVPATPVRSAVAAYESAKTNGHAVTVIEPPRKPLPPRFSIVIHADGSADVTLNLNRISAADAMRCMSVLGSANLLSEEQNG